MTSGRRCSAAARPGPLRKLVELQRTRGVDVVESRVEAKVRSPREEREETGDKPESVLEQVATDLVDASPSRALEVSKPVARLAEALLGERRPSVLLVGPSGVGKTAVVHELVRRRQGHGLGRTPFWSTTGARIVAGATGSACGRSAARSSWARPRRPARYSTSRASSS